MGTGQQVIVRINDRGPFHAGRIVDVSYTAALKLGLLNKGTREVELERLLPEDIEQMAAADGANRMRLVGELEALLRDDKMP